MSGRKKGAKFKDRLQGIVVKAIQPGRDDGHLEGRTDEEREKERHRDGGSEAGAVGGTRDARATFGEHAMVIMDRLLKDNLVNEVLKLGPCEEMLGLTALSMTASLGHVEGSRRLLEAGASVDDKSSDGSTALLNALHWRHLPVLELLLQHGADVTAANNDGDNALMVAVRHGDVRAISSLWPYRKHLDINHANNSGNAALHLAAQRKWESCVQFLIQKGAHVNRQNNAGYTALHIAAINGDQPTAQRLLVAGASLLLEDKNGNTAFCLAADSGHDFLAGYLLGQLKPEDRGFFCKRRIEKTQAQLVSGDYVLPALFFLTSDPSLRDTLYQCNFIGAMVQILERRELTRESTIPSCHVCCNLMNNAFAVPDERFVQQFLEARGPETILERLENRNFDQGLGKEVGYGPGQELRVEVYRTLLLLPVLGLVETKAGREWLQANRQRLTAHLRCLTCYHELLQRVSEVKLELCGKEIKLDRSSTVERFLAFFKTLETQDHEEKVRELLELEEKEKSRKVRKREKKRQQRIKQKMKARGTDTVAPGKYAAVGSEPSSSKPRVLDALDDIPLTVGPDGVQDVAETAIAASLASRTRADPRDNEDEWVMVGGKRTYPLKLRLAGLPTDVENKPHKEHHPQQPHQQHQAECRPARSSETLSATCLPHPHSKSRHHSQSTEDEASSNKLSQTPASDYSTDTDATVDNDLQMLEDCSFMPAVSAGATGGTAVGGGAGSGGGGVSGGGGGGGGATHRYPPAEDTRGGGAKTKVTTGGGGGAGGMRWADVARYGGQCAQSSEIPTPARASPAEPHQHEQLSEGQQMQSLQHETVGGPRKESYKEDFPPLGEKDVSCLQDQQQDTGLRGDSGLPFAGALYGQSERVLEAIYESIAVMSSAFASTKAEASDVDRNALCKALSEWMLQSALAQGLVSSSDPSQPVPAANFPLDCLLAATSHAARASPNLVATPEHGGSDSPCPSERESVSSSFPPSVPSARLRQSPLQSQSLYGWPEKAPQNTAETQGAVAHGYSAPPVGGAECTLAAARPTFVELQDARSAQIMSTLLSSCAQNVAKELQPKSSVSTETLCAETVERSQTKTPSAVCRNKEEGMYAAGRSCTEDTVPQSSKIDLWMGVGETERNRRRLATSRLADWTSPLGGAKGSGLPNTNNLVYGMPICDSNDLYGLSVASGSLDNTRTMDFAWKDSDRTGQPRSVASPVSISGSIMASFNTVVTSKQPDTKQKLDYRPEDSKSRPKPECRDETVSLGQTDTQPKAKSAVVSVPRSSDSESQQSSPTEHRSETQPEDFYSTTPESSSSYYLNTYDNFRQLSPHASSTSSATGLQECLAPGFLRAATGNIHPYDRSRDKYEGLMEEGSVFQGIYGNMGLLPSGTPYDEQGCGQIRVAPDNDRCYSDMSTTPEKEFAHDTRSRFQKPWLAVGHGRPQRTSPDGKEKESAAATDKPTTPVPGWTQTKDTGASNKEDDASCNIVSDLVLSSTETQSVDRPESPPVLFPETLRDEDPNDRPSAPDVFPSIHDMPENDLFQGVFTNSYFLEQIAIDQIRRRLRAMGGGDQLMKNSVLFHDLDYYASLYGVRLRDVLGPQDEPKASSADSSRCRKSASGRLHSGWRALVKELGSRHTDKAAAQQAEIKDAEIAEDELADDPVTSDWPWNSRVTAPRIVTSEGGEEEGWWQEGGGSRRWRTWLKQILDMPWTMRRQYGKIVLPARSMEFNIGRTGSHPLILGFLTDGTEVGVLALDRTRHALDTRLMATVAADSEPDVHFVLRYKAVWECAGRVYLAMELCDYTLDEYVGIVRLDHRQDPLSANRLAWQMLKGLKYLHSNFTVPHGNLMPGWIFVDCDGRLRLAGYGLRDVMSSFRSGASREFPDKVASLAGDARFWRATEHVAGTQTEPNFRSDIQVAGMLLHYILTGGRHPFGDSAAEVENNLRHNTPRPAHVSQEADHLLSTMIKSDPEARPSIDACLKHPFFWSGEKRFRLVLIVGSDILTEMKTCVPLTGPGSASMVDILNVIPINTVSDNWLGEVDPVLAKEMRAFRQYKNTLPELVLFVYNCCLHFDKMSTVAKEVLDDPCKYFQTKFPALFMAVYKAMRASDRTDRTCYKPFF